MPRSCQTKEPSSFMSRSDGFVHTPDDALVEEIDVLNGPTVVGSVLSQSMKS